MNSAKTLKNALKPFYGLILILFVAAAAVTYFTDKLSVGNFITVAFVVAVTALVLAFFGWLTIRAGILFVVMAVILIAGIAYSEYPKVKTDQYQAVFLTSGQVYFGHLKDANTRNPTLTDVYYLRSNPQNPQGSTDTQSQSNSQTEPQVSLVKLGNELHGPEDVMAIKADKILFWENLKDSGKVVKAIKENEKKN